MAECGSKAFVALSAWGPGPPKVGARPQLAVERVLTCHVGAGHEGRHQDGEWLWS